MKIRVKSFGELPSGEQVSLFVLENGNGMSAEISTFGGALTRLIVPGRNDTVDDVVLGYDALEQYITNKGYLGVIVGRNANRIAGAEFTLGETLWKLCKNDGGNNLHGGPFGLSFRLFSAKTHIYEDSASLSLFCEIPHNSDDFPGNLVVTIVYTLTSGNSLKISYHAVSDADTVINLTHHAYFNLAGHAGGDIYPQTIQINADYFCPGRADCLTTGEILSVLGSPFDLRSPRAFGGCLMSDCEQLRQFGGFDHNFVLRGKDYRLAATVSDPASERVMDVFTDMPGIQLYTANNLESGLYKDNAVYAKHHAFCLETQYFPNAVNMPWLVSPLFRAGEEFVSATEYKFRIN